MSSVYLHQEVIRDLVVTTPTVRKEALDRLLRVAHLRNLFEGLKQVKIRDYESSISDTYASLEDTVSTIAKTYEKELADDADRARSLGVKEKELSPAGLRARVEKALARLQEAAQEAETELAEIETPATPAETRSFLKSLKEATKRIRTENPPSRSRSDLDKKKQLIERALSLYEIELEALKAKKSQKQDFERKFGTLERILQERERLEIEENKLKEELGRVNRRVHVVTETISYLEGLEDKTGPSPCPACEQTIVPEKILERLRAWQEEFAGRTRSTQKEAQEITQKMNALSQNEKTLRALIEQDIPEAERAVQKAVASLLEALGSKVERDEDLVAVARKRLNSIEDDLDKIEGIDREAEAIESIANVLKRKEKIRDLEQVRQSPEWKALDRARDRLNEKLEQIQKVKDAVSEILRERSEARITETRDEVRTIYRKLVERPDFEWLEIDPETYDVYAVSDAGTEREKVLTFFNQGDMNCAALSIFLALGSAARQEDGPGFIMMDDPSQSLDSTQKLRFARLLGDLSEQKQILLSTMDQELLEFLKQEITKKKKIYTFGQWDPRTGPRICAE